MKKKDNQQEAVSSTEYTKAYYQSSCDGFEEFKESNGILLPKRLKTPFDLAMIAPGEFVLDIGCGRGEILYHVAKLEAFACGIDYSIDAIKIASDNIKVIGQDYARCISLQIADAKKLPLKSESVDLVFMIDVVEHLYPSELSKSYDEIWRVLKKGGKLIIHTMPNLWYYNVGYPLFRAVQKIRNVTLPKDPRERWPYIHVHVNEQTPWSLYKSLQNKGFIAKIWLESTQNYDKYDANRVMKLGMKVITKFYPFKFLFCNDIFAVCLKSRIKS